MDEKLHLVSFFALRLALAVVYLWFGFLKLFNVSPVLDIIAQAYPFIAQNHVLYGILGVLEIIIGLGIMVPYVARWMLSVLIAHLLFATFGVLFFPQAFTTSFPLLSVAGEFVVKNFVLMSGALVLISHDRKLRQGEPN